MLTINMIYFKNQLDILAKEIEDYELTKMNLFNQLKNCCINWRDGRTNSFENKINDEKKENELILQNLKKIKMIFDYIYEKYNILGKKINCNYDNRNSVIAEFDEKISEINNIISKYDALNNSLSNLKYNKRVQKITRGRDILHNNCNKLNNYKNYVKQLFTFFESTENEVKAKIVSVQEIKVNDFNPTLLNDGSTDGKASIQKELLEQNIEDMKIYIQQEKQQLQKIISTMLECANEYNSNNTSSIMTLIEKTKIELDLMCNKRNIYVNVINGILDDYMAGKKAAITALERPASNGMWQDMIQ